MCKSNMRWNRCGLYIIIMYLYSWVVAFMNGVWKGYILGLGFMMSVLMMLTSTCKCILEENVGNDDDSSDE